MYCNICGKKISSNKTSCDECHKKHQDALRIFINNNSLHVNTLTNIDKHVIITLEEE